MTWDISVITEEIRSAGFGFAPAEQFRALLTPAALAEWLSFARAGRTSASTPTWPMVAAIAADASRPSEGIVRKAHQPHYQSRDYNLLIPSP